MSDDLDLRAIHRRHEPDPRFVAALGDRLEAIMANSASADVSTDGARALTVELEPGDSQRPPARHSRRVFGVAVVLAAASVAVFAVVISRDRASRDDAYVSQGGPQPNGWVAFTQRDRSDDRDVYLVREGKSPRRVAGSDTDTSAQVCPAFSPDGERLVFGQATGSPDSGYEDDAELVIIEVGADGSTSGTTTIPVEDLSAPPCPMWSPDGRWLAFGAGGEVWLVDTVTEELRRLAGYAATDLEWLPGTDELAIADNGIHVYSVTTGETRSLGIEGAAQLAWSPDGTTVAFTRCALSASVSPELCVSRVGPDEAEHDSTSLWLVDADGTNERQVAAAYRVNHGVGPVWSPDGRYIAYQRVIGCCESHEVVLVTADDNHRGTALGTDVVISPPTTPGTDGPVSWYPWSVTWSPDGSMLLYIAWNDACHGDNDASAECGGRLEGGGVLAVPVDTTKAPFVLADASWLIGVNEGQPWLPMQTWGRQPLG
jgi:Tol biopolymer transport system component